MVQNSQVTKKGMGVYKAVFASAEVNVTTDAETDRCPDPEERVHSRLANCGDQEPHKSSCLFTATEQVFNTKR